MASDSLLQSKTGEQSCEGKMRAETVKIVGAGKPGWGQELRQYEALDRSWTNAGTQQNAEGEPGANLPQSGCPIKRGAGRTRGLVADS